jgi:hypothetical protein
MSDIDSADFSRKHEAAAQPDQQIQDAIASRAKARQIPCAVAFDIARNLEAQPANVGMTIDLMNYRITKCQLGLFGYQPHKKIVTPMEKINPALSKAISDRHRDGRLSCKAVWEIAAQLDVSKMTVSRACEGMQIKIKPCQLGAF